MKHYICLALFSLSLITNCAFAQTTFNENAFADSNSFTKYPPEYRDGVNLMKQIIPDKKYVYWELVDVTVMNLESYGKIIFSSGQRPADKVFKNPMGGITWDCPPGICYKFIAYVDDSEVHYVKNEEDFIKFIGEIDNLEEATLIAEYTGSFVLYPLRIGSQKRGGAYRKVKDGYEIILSRWETCPVSAEAKKITIDKKGITKKESLGVYYKTTDCYKI